MLLVDMECSHCGLPTTEDDLYLSLDCGELTCEGCFDEGKSKSLKDAAFQDVQEVDVKSLQEENNKLKEENKKQQERAEKFRVKLCDRNQELVKALSPWKKNAQDHKRILEAIGELQEENKKLKEELEEAKCSMPDLCVDCDRLFDLHSAMNKITCEEDEGLRKKYDEYFGSDKDRGDLCKQCIREELP